MLIFILNNSTKIKNKNNQLKTLKSTSSETLFDKNTKPDLNNRFHCDFKQLGKLFSGPSVCC